MKSNSEAVSSSGEENLKILSKRPLQSYVYDINQGLAFEHFAPSYIARSLGRLPYLLNIFFKLSQTQSNIIELFTQDELALIEKMNTKDNESLKIQIQELNQCSSALKLREIPGRVDCQKTVLELKTKNLSNDKYYDELMKQINGEIDFIFPTVKYETLKTFITNHQSSLFSNVENLDYDNSDEIILIGKVGLNIFSKSKNGKEDEIVRKIIQMNKLVSFFSYVEEMMILYGKYLPSFISKFKQDFGISLNPLQKKSPFIYLLVTNSEISDFKCYKEDTSKKTEFEEKLYKTKPFPYICLYIPFSQLISYSFIDRTQSEQEIKRLQDALKEKKIQLLR